jgi:hypothetical protein
VDFACDWPDWDPVGPGFVCLTEDGDWARITEDGEVVGRFDAGSTGLRELGLPYFSPDGSRIYTVTWSEDGVRGLWWIPRSGGLATLAMSSDDPNQLLHNQIAVGEDRIFFTIEEGEGDIRVVDLEW